MPLIALLFLITNWSTPPDSVRFGVYWDVPNNVNEAKRDLSFFQKNGYQELLIDGIIPVDVIDLINSYDFLVHVNLGRKFVTNTVLQQEKDLFEAQLYDAYYYYSEYQCVSSFGLFTYGSVFDDEFVNGIQALNNRVSGTIKFPFYYISQPDSSDLLSAYNIGRYLNYLPNMDYQPADLGRFSGIIYSGNSENLTARNFQELIYKSNGKTIFLPSSIIFDESKQDILNSWILTFIKDNHSLLELDTIKHTDEHPNYLVFLFWCCVVIFGSHFSFEPNYRKSVSRYFFAHSFFASDIMDNRMRLNLSTFLAGLVQMTLAGMITLLFFEHILSDLGQQALAHSFSYIDNFTGSKLAIFLAGMIQYVIFQTVIIIWLYISFKDFKSIYQPATLIIWPQLANLFISIIVVNAFFNNVSGFWILTFSLLYMFVVFFSYFFALSDIFKLGRKASAKNLLKTGIPYSMLLIFGLGYYFTEIGFYDMLELAYHLK